MSQTILIVNNDPSLLDNAKEIIRQNSLKIEILTENNRLSALERLKKNKNIDYLAMTLTIPRITDGYILLAKVADKIFPSKKIFVFTKEITSKVICSVKMHKVDNIYKITEIRSFFEKISSNENITREIGIYNDDIKIITEALNQVMGPVGHFIFEKCYSPEENIYQKNSLIEKIAKEIGNKEQIEDFYKLLRTT